MHIVYICREYPPSLRGGGIASYLKIVAEGFTTRGHKVTVVTANDDTSVEKRETVNGVSVIRLAGGDFCIPKAESKSGFIHKFRFMYRFHSYRRRVLAEVKRLDKIDIIEVAEFGAEALYLKGISIPVVYRLHTPALFDHNNQTIQSVSLGNFPYYYGGLKEIELLRKNARFITSCSSSLKQWAVKYCSLNSESIKVIYNPVQSDFLKSYESERTDCTPKPYVFFAGTICDWKGVEDLICACKVLNDNGFEIPLFMAGKTGEYAKKLKVKYSACTWLHFLGKINQEELKGYYRNATAVCFPSWWENMPMVCIEAMSMGAIVIGSDSGGMAEIIEDGVSGFLMSPKRPEKWAEKIKEISGLTPRQRKEISFNAHRRVATTFSLDSILGSTESYYNYCISSNNKN